MTYSVFCTATEAQADTIVRNLQAGGFSGSEISVLMADRGVTKDFAIERNTKMPEGAATGAGTGAVVGGALGWMAGIGALAIPGVGPLIAAGPILAALSGVAIGGAVGGLTGTLIGMGIPEYEAKHYEGKLKSGVVLISTHAADEHRSKRAQEIFERAGANDITTAGSESTTSRGAV